MAPRPKQQTTSDPAYLTRREDIRVAATRVFAARGFTSATMRDIAVETGILAGSLYHYFRSKDEILVEGLQVFYADTLRDLQEVVDRGHDPETTLTEMIALAVRYLVERRDEATIILNDFDYLRALPSFAFIVDAAAEVERLWVGVLDDARTAGQFRSEMGSTMAYRTIMGAIFSAARWFDPNGAMDLDAFVTQQCKTFVEGLAVAKRSRKPARRRKRA